MNLKKDGRIVRIATINADNLRTRNAMERLSDLLKRKGIDIARIQETHNESMGTFEIGDYIIIFGGNNTQDDQLLEDKGSNKKAGVAIAIKKQ